MRPRRSASPCEITSPTYSLTSSPLGTCSPMNAPQPWMDDRPISTRRLLPFWRLVCAAIRGEGRRKQMRNQRGHEMGWKGARSSSSPWCCADAALPHALARSQLLTLRHQRLVRRPALHLGSSSSSISSVTQLSQGPHKSGSHSRRDAKQGQLAERQPELRHEQPGKRIEHCSGSHAQCFVQKTPIALHEQPLFASEHAPSCEHGTWG